MKRNKSIIGAFIVVFVVGCFVLQSCQYVGAPLYVPHCATVSEQYEFAVNTHRKQIPNSRLFSFAKPQSRAERVEKVIYSYSKVIEFFPEDEVITPVAMVDIGNCFALLKKYKKAMKVYEKALNKYPNNDFVYASCLYNIGKTYAKMDKYAKALEYYEQCLMEFPSPEKEDVKAIVEACRTNLELIK